MNKTIYIFSVLLLIVFCGCSRTFTIVREDSAVNRLNIKILNRSCDTGESEVYLKNGEILEVHEVSLTGDSLSFVDNIPESKRVLHRNEVDKIITRDGVGSFILGMGLSVPSAIVSAVVIGLAFKPGGGHPGPAGLLVIIPSVGLITGITAGEIIGVDKVFVFKQ